MSEAFSIPTLGRLQAVDLREVWASEPYSFTPWLALPENLQFLAESIGLPGLELVATERPVDVFSADIVARAADTGETVLIENQIERSDHTHLGQILTYAAGLEAAIIVWTARRFTDGHRAAIDWLNRITGADFAFFAVEIEAVRIGDSVAAPRFNVVARPNDWARSLRGVSHKTGPAAPANDNARFWDGYQQAAEAVGAPIRRATPQVRDTNYYVPTALKNVYFSGWRATGSKSVGVYLSLFGAEADRLYSLLEERRAEIETAFGAELRWNVRKPGWVYWIVTGEMTVPSDEADWPRQQLWMAEHMLRLSKVFEVFLQDVKEAA